MARRTGVGIDTICFYARRGVFEKPLRRDSGYRQYSEEVVRHIHLFSGQRLGLSLKEITDLLTLRTDGRTSCEQVKAATLTKLDQVERKLLELERIRQGQALLQVAALCTRAGPASACPMLDALNQQMLLEPLATDQEHRWMVATVYATLTTAFSTTAFSAPETASEWNFPSLLGLVGLDRSSSFPPRVRPVLRLNTCAGCAGASSAS